MSQSNQLTQPAPESTPLYTFDSYLSKVTDENGRFMAWKMTSSRNSFPASQIAPGESHTFTLDPVKYSNSFEQYRRLLNLETLPAQMYEYTISATDDSFSVTGMTETTVRVAIVDLVSKSNPNTKLMMVRPPINFRVHALPQKPTEDVDVGAGNLFNMFGENDGDY